VHSFPRYGEPSIRVSSLDRNAVRQLEGVDLDKVFIDKASGKNTARPQLHGALEYLREGDLLVGPVHTTSGGWRCERKTVHPLPCQTAAVSSRAPYCTVRVTVPELTT